MSPIFTVLGDSNVRNHVTKTSRRANPSLSAAQIVPCGHLAIFADSIIKTRNESTVCIVSCITNFLTCVEGTNTPAHRVDPVLQEVQAVLQEVCAGNPDRTYMISPPMYRAAPTWYREGLSEILIQFAQKFDIKSRVTHETSIRVSLLKLMAQRYCDSNPGGKAQVIHYDPRPLIKITPPSSSSDRRTRSYNFVEAAKTFPSNFTASELDPILKRINPKLSGKLRSIFIVLSDDVYQKKSRNRARGDRGERADRGERGDRGDREDRGDRTNRGSRGSRSERGSRSDSDQDDEDMASGGRSPSPPPPATAPGTASRSRGHKRGLPPSKGNAAKK